MPKNFPKPVLQVENLSVRFPIKRDGFFAKKSYLYAVNDISFQINRGETLAIVGESGSGKTTAALAIARLVNAIAGKVKLLDKDFFALSGPELRQARAKVQFIFQDPYSSLNPRLRAEEVVSEPLDNLVAVAKSEKRQIIDRIFQAVGLRKEQQRLFPHQFSGGQRQRIGIARALATRPELVICDEPVSALDVAVQAQILNLLRKLQQEFNLTYLFISHDLGVVQYLCDYIAVMYMGKIVEYGDRLSVFNQPRHPYTAALLAAVPSVDKTRRQQTKSVPIPANPADSGNSAQGCRFANRCPIAQPICQQAHPDFTKINATHQVACYLAS